jgi:hypothetical protein
LFLVKTVYSPSSSRCPRSYRGNSASHCGSGGEKIFLKNLQENRGKAGKGATSNASKKDRLWQARGPGSVNPRTPLSTSPTKEWTQIARKKETNKTRRKQVVLSVPLPSKENRKKIVTTAAPFYPDVLFIGRVESPPSPTTSRLHPERNLLSGNPADEV